MWRLVSLCLLGLFARPVFAGVGASYLNLNLRESQYLGQSPSASSAGRTATVVTADLNLETQSAQFNFKLNPVFQGVLEQREEKYFGVPEFYVQPRRIVPGFDLTIGRKKRQWSRLDEEFNLGVWQPQLRWDYLAPTQQGLTGVFFDWSLSSNLHFTFFTSPLFIPDQGPEFQLRGGRFFSANRWFAPPNPSLSLFQDTGFAKEAPLYFQIERPPNSEIFTHSSFGFSLNYQSGGAIWSQVSYAYKPRNQIHIGIESANAASPYEINAVMHPKVVSHNVLTWETGFDRVDDRGWMSLTADLPLASGFPSTFAEPALDNLAIGGFAYQHYIRPWLGVPSWLQYSYMRVLHFQKSNQRQSLAGGSFQSSFGSYAYQELAALDWRLLLRQNRTDHLYLRNRYSYSIPEGGGWLSAVLDWAKGDFTWSLGLDILGSQVGADSPQAGLFTRYRANDRLYGALSYVF